MSYASFKYKIDFLHCSVIHRAMALVNPNYTIIPADIFRHHILPFFRGVTSITHTDGIVEYISPGGTVSYKVEYGQAVGAMLIEEPYHLRINFVISLSSLSHSSSTTPPKFTHLAAATISFDNIYSCKRIIRQFAAGVTRYQKLRCMKEIIGQIKRRQTSVLNRLKTASEHDNMIEECYNFIVDEMYRSR